MASPGQYIGITSVLICYSVALFYLVPSLNPEILEPSLSSKFSYFMIVYGLGIASTYFSRIFYVSDVSFRYELVAGLAITIVLFGGVGAPVLRLAQ